MQGFVDRATEGPQHRRTTDQAIVGVDTTAGLEAVPDTSESGEILIADGSGDPDHTQLRDGEATDEEVHSSVLNAQLNEGRDDVPLRPGDHVSVDGLADVYVVMRKCSARAGDYHFEEGDESLADREGCEPTADVYQVADPNASENDLADCPRKPVPRSRVTLETAISGNGGGE